jgi:hypothetical protein
MPQDYFHNLLIILIIFIGEWLPGASAGIASHQAAFSE